MELSNYDVVVLTQQEESFVSGGSFFEALGRIVGYVKGVVTSPTNDTWMTQVPPNVLFS